MASPSTASLPAEPIPVAADLRPLSTSELVDRGFSLYRAHFAGFFLLALLTQAAPLLVQVISSTANLAPMQTAGPVEPSTGLLVRLIAWLVLWIVAHLATFIFGITITYYVADAYLGRTPSVSLALRRTARLIGPSIRTSLLNLGLIGLTFIFPFLALLAVEVVYVMYPPAEFTAVVLMAAGAFVLLVASVAPLLIVFMRLMATQPALALEGLAGWRAVRRSSQLVRYDPGLGIMYWGEMRLSFLLLPLFVIEMLTLSLTLVPYILAQVGDALHHGNGAQWAGPGQVSLALSQVLSFLADSLILPLYVIATTLFYYDVRVRREGYDLELMAERLEEVA
jgi:hypothetical protein